jgi:hypothetical protein
MASNSDHGRDWGVKAGGALAFLMLALLVWARLPPPQLKADEQVFNTVDALFTALTARDRARLDDCERRLKAYREQGKTSRAAAARLDAIIQQAHDGQWEPAARKLYDFMLAQRG